MHIQEIDTERSLKNLMSPGKRFLKAFIEYCLNIGNIFPIFQQGNCDEI